MRAELHIIITCSPILLRVSTPAAANKERETDMMESWKVTFYQGYLCIYNGMPKNAMHVKTNNRRLQEKQNGIKYAERRRENQMRRADSLLRTLPGRTGKKKGIKDLSCRDDCSSHAA